MTKVVEVYCSAHWRESPPDDRARVIATHLDVELTWDGQRKTADLCDEHKARADREMAWLLSVADPAPPEGMAQRRPARGRPLGQPLRAGGRTSSGQPTGDELAAIKAWVDAEGITRPDDPRRPAYRRRSSPGDYFPVWLMERWDARNRALTEAEPSAAAG